MTDKNPNGFIKYSGLAFEMLAFILLGVWGGYELDEFYSTETPWFTVILSLFSIIASMIYVIRKLPKQ